MFDLLCWLPILLGMLLSALLTWWYLKNKYRAQYQGKIDDLTHKKNQLNNELIASRNEHSTLVSEFDVLNKKYDTQTTEVSNLTTKVTGLENDKQLLTIEKNTLKTENSTLKTKVDGLNTEVSTLTTKVTDLDTKPETSNNDSKKSLLGKAAVGTAAAGAGIAATASNFVNGSHKDEAGSVEVETTHISATQIDNGINTDEYLDENTKSKSLLGTVIAGAGAVASKIKGEHIEETIPEFDAQHAKDVFGKTIKLDDLSIIEGIGPKIQELFHAAGITTWAKLAHTPVDTCTKILTDAGSHYEMHDPTTWPEQAELAAKGKWKKLAKWQDELDGGKK